MGSVKDLFIIEQPQETRAGKGMFVFSDRYSVFDWGEMPDKIPHKGEALCMLTSYFFELAEKRGVKTHYLGLIDKDDQEKRLAELNSASNRMMVKLLRVVEPEYRDGTYDYTPIKNLNANYLIPLEVIYRFSLPEGSSVFRRISEGSLTPSDLGLNEPPVPGTVLKEPFIDFSTKLEHFDRYLNRKEALEISGLSEDKFNQLVDMAKDLAKMIRDAYEEIGINNEDGKFEFGVDESGDIILIDALGTPDECRFSKDGVTLSKEFARIFYRGSNWHKELEAAKKSFGKDWREHVRLKPEPLPSEDLELLSNIYTSLTNSLLKKKVFETDYTLEELISKIKERLS
ncbi:MAG: phosphoribosylaminoimidazolesuccinocarboxamide synthase [Actinobacteria bacterium]|nr:phosphoribosylaminoimidazolesuccinocarboxamide synthase [Actinomycetota bacterium]